MTIWNITWNMVNMELKSLRRWNEKVLATAEDWPEEVFYRLYTRCGDAYNEDLWQAYREQEIKFIGYSAGITTQRSPEGYDYLRKTYGEDIYLAERATSKRYKVVYFSREIAEQIEFVWNKTPDWIWKQQQARLAFVQKECRRIVYHERRHLIQDWYKDRNPRLIHVPDEALEQDANHWSENYRKLMYNPN